MPLASNSDKALEVLAVFLPNTISHIIQSKGRTWAVKWLLEIRVEKLAFTFLRECGLMIFSREY
jgi:hypothetical protein